MATFYELIQSAVLTETINDPLSGLPRVLPDAFYNVTKQVIGNRHEWYAFKGQRKLARASNSDSPSKGSALQGTDYESAQGMHLPEHIVLPHDVLMGLEETNTARAQLARSQIAGFIREFRRKFDNTRNAAVMSVIRNGAIWLDSDGYVQGSSSGASRTIDFGVPGNNQNQLNGIISASWATAGTEILEHIEGIKSAAVQTSGYPIRHAFYGRKIPTYLANNNTAKEILRTDPLLAQAIKNRGTFQIQNITFHPMDEGFFETASGSITKWWGDDTLVFTPDPSEEWYGFEEGSSLIPNSVGGGASTSPESAVGNATLRFGMAAYGMVQADPLGVKIVAIDNFLPILKVPSAIFIADVTP